MAYTERTCTIDKSDKIISFHRKNENSESNIVMDEDDDEGNMIKTIYMSINKQDAVKIVNFLTATYDIK